ncbi:MAG: enoyl-CoA hydratase/isomerase family protein [Planctomycetes bacterium]|nr:enoyl-CoA hydratase/isomerase family protein [Planctomycetota bacterium]
MEHPDYETLELVPAGNVLHVRLNRPDKRNAFNGTVVEELADCFARIDADPQARVVVLSGNGKSFSAGADLAWMIEQSELSERDNAASATRMAGMFLAIARCSKPVVARIHGHALGGGSGLTAAADIAVATHSTVFGLTEVKLGIVPAVISPFVMQKIGVGRARALFLTGERFDGREAERVGLVHRAVAESELDAEVDRVVAELLGSGPAAVASAKRLIGVVGALSLEDAIPVTAQWIAALRATPEAREGMRAFLDKRPAEWVQQ